MCGWKWAKYINNICVVFVILRHYTMLPKPTTYAHNSKDRFSMPINNSIIQLTNYYNTTAKSWLICFFEACLISEARQMSTSARISLNTTGQFVHAATFLKITTWLIYDATDGFI